MSESLLGEMANAQLENPQISKLMTILMEQWAREKDHEVKQQLLRTTVLRYADAESKLAEMNRMKNRFIGLVAHDLRNPLVSIRGLSEILLDEDVEPLSDQQRDFLSTIYGASNSLLTLVNDILDMAVMENGALRLQIRNESLSRLIRERVKVNAIVAAKKQITVEEDLARLPAMPFDRNRIGQVLDNLIGNAIKFSSEHSKVFVSLYRKNGTAIVSVRDQGMGIPSEEQAQVFSAYPRLSNQPTGGEKSTGMGLTIARKIVEEHNGSLTVASKVGEGSTFSFTLPLGADDVE
jgi:two-component system, sensor histidine kinase and response regulator